MVKHPNGVVLRVVKEMLHEIIRGHELDPTALLQLPTFQHVLFLQGHLAGFAMGRISREDSLQKIGKVLGFSPSHRSVAIHFVAFSMASLIGAIYHQHELDSNIDGVFIVSPCQITCRRPAKNTIFKFSSCKVRAGLQVMDESQNLAMSRKSARLDLYNGVFRTGNSVVNLEVGSERLELGCRTFTKQVCHDQYPFGNSGGPHCVSYMVRLKQIRSFQLYLSLALTPHQASSIAASECYLKAIGRTTQPFRPSLIMLVNAFLAHVLLLAQFLTLCRCLDVASNRRAVHQSVIAAAGQCEAALCRRVKSLGRMIKEHARQCASKVKTDHRRLKYLDNRRCFEYRESLQ